MSPGADADDLEATQRRQGEAEAARVREINPGVGEAIQTSGARSRIAPRASTISRSLRLNRGRRLRLLSGNSKEWKSGLLGSQF
jgi:hypothetical protein